VITTLSRQALRLYFATESYGKLKSVKREEKAPRQQPLSDFEAKVAALLAVPKAELQELEMARSKKQRPKGKKGAA
jgi:hypothetical protein